jgi:hypothetical protein
MPRALRFRRFDREWLRGKPLHLSLMFGSAVRALKAQHIGPDTGQGGVVDIKLKINRLSGLTAPTSEKEASMTADVPCVGPPLCPKCKTRPISALPESQCNQAIQR